VKRRTYNRRRRRETGGEFPLQHGAPVMKTKTSKENAAAARQTLCGAEITPLPRDLPYTTVSLCPECSRKIDARLFEENGKVYMEKTCPDHGYCRDLIFSDVDIYRQALIRSRQ